MTAFPESADPDNDLTALPETREPLGRMVRQIWINWAKEQANPKPSWLLPWESLDDGQKEVDMWIGETLHTAGRRSILDPLEDEHTDLLERLAMAFADRVNNREPDDGAYDLAATALPVVEDEVRRRAARAVTALDVPARAAKLWSLLHNGRSPQGCWDAESQRFHEHVITLLDGGP